MFSPALICLYAAATCILIVAVTFIPQIVRARAAAREGEAWEELETQPGWMRKPVGWAEVYWGMSAGQLADHLYEEFYGEKCPRAIKV